ncbi:hypothetical protein EBB07_17370 [Paenibacillaceae bacterium]|nr:hypothetical protein EBB07_17370 [Paenibacillaceae bacterium]
MSQPSIPNITPLISVTKNESISLLLSSIAMSELAMSHLINAEAEKIQAFVQHAHCSMNVNTKTFIQFNHSVSKLINAITMEQWLSLNKLDRIIQLIDENYCDFKEDTDKENLDHYEEYCHE